MLVMFVFFEQAAQRCQEAEQKFRDLNVLQQGLKLTWVADEVSILFF